MTNHYNSATIKTGGEYEFTKKNADESVQVSEDSTNTEQIEKGLWLYPPGNDWLPEVREGANPRSQIGSRIRGMSHLHGGYDPESWFDDMKKAQPKIKR